MNTITCLWKITAKSDEATTYECAICHATLSMEKSLTPPRRECQVENCAPCECPDSGFCSRHKMSKSDMLYRLCQNDSEQRATWDYVTMTGRSPNGVVPSASRRVVNFGLAAIRHFFSGQGTRTDSEIEAILEICHACPSGLFNGSYCESLACGCFLNKKKHFSKIAWKSENCPENHW